MTVDLPRAETVVGADAAPQPDDRVVLTYDQRFVRRKRMESEGGIAFLIDLPETTSLQAGDAFVLSDGRCIVVAAAIEPVLVIRGDLPRLAWHIGNRHTPCQFAGDALVIRADHVLLSMLTRLGASVFADQAPFAPEGGAYGMGRTLGHSHGPDHAHGPSDNHGHEHTAFGNVARASPVRWLMRSPQDRVMVPHELPEHGPFDDPAP